MTNPHINDDGTSKTGKTTIVGAVITMLGVFAVAKPKYLPIIGAIQAAAPQIQDAVGVIITSVGTVVTAVAHPPKWLRKVFGK